MNCTPSQQPLRIEAQMVVVSDPNSPLLGSPLRMALHDAKDGIYEMNRHEPDNESDARKNLLSRLADVFETTRPMALNFPDANKLPAPDADIGVDDYLTKYEEALANKQIAGFRPFGEYLIVELLNDTVLVQKTNLILEKPIEPLLVCLDETQYWKDTEPKVQEAGRIFATYLVDTSTAIHLAEITPSYDLRWIYTTPQNDDDDHTVHDWIREHNNPASENDMYLHIRAVENLSDSKKRYEQRHYLEADQDYEQAMESLMDNLKGNPRLEVPETRQPSPGM